MKKNYLIIAIVLLFHTAQAQNTAIPDQNFEQALIDLGYDDVIDGQVLTANIAGVTILEIDSQGIQDLTGIQDFAALIELDAEDNLLTSIDLSQNTALEFLIIGENPLTTLDISNNPELEYLYAWDCSISSLDLSNNINLIELDVEENNLTQLDLSNNPNLEVLFCEDNPNLSFINLKNGNTVGLEELYARNIANDACIQVDDAQAATNADTFPYDDWRVDSTTTFSEDCSLSLNSFAREKLRFFPNPAIDQITFLNSSLTSYEIYDTKGSVISSNTKFTGSSIDVAFLKPGIYFIRAYNDINQNQTIQFIKK